MTFDLKGFLLMTLVAIASAAGFWLLRAHWGHALGIAPYLLFLACPLMHLFMHKGHGGHGIDHTQGRATPPSGG
ncbi:DUF2933 domain-containing protein [Phenylobacterium sp. VNQ135]|uniref:DUF2933 domain-containing protein n=1 Tax=Phenylobacterium sp. VNQ135 TaxID=3400922 RepID=UPI003BFED6A7